MISSLYSGFKLYYESVERRTQPNCPTDIPNLPTTQAPTSRTTVPASISNSVASSLIKDNVCRGNEITIDIPENFVLFPINWYYGITPDETCNTISPQNCKTPAQFTCSTTGSCKVSLLNNVPLAECNGEFASYIGLEYRFIPCKC